MQEEKLLKLGISAVAVNQAVVAEAQQNGSEAVLWDKAVAGRVILLSPEMLRSRTATTRLQLGQIHATSGFQSRASILVIDELHLLWAWGTTFREEYRSIGKTRHRLHTRVRALLLSATLDPEILPSILSELGLELGRPDLLDIHRSNLRPEIRVTTRTLDSNLSSSFSFPEFRWLLRQSGITIIFVDNRGAALRIALYLRRCDRPHAKYVRKYDSMNDKETYDAQTREMTRDTAAVEKHGLIIVATSILTTGMDINDVKRVISIDPKDLAEEVQREGRLNREGTPGLIVESYTYFKSATVKKAVKFLAALDQLTSPTKDQIRKLEEEHQITRQWALRIAAGCRSHRQNVQHHNPPFGIPPCTCIICMENPAPLNPPCLCSTCKPGESMLDRFLQREAETEAENIQMTSTVPDTVTRTTETIIRKHLRDLEDDLAEDESANPFGLYVPGGLFSEGAVKVRYFIACQSFHLTDIIGHHYTPIRY